MSRFKWAALALLTGALISSAWADPFAPARINSPAGLVNTHVKFLGREVVCLDRGGRPRPGYLLRRGKGNWERFDKLVRKKFHSRRRQRRAVRNLRRICSASSSSSSFSSSAGSQSSASSASGQIVIAVWYQSGDPATIAKWKNRGVDTFIGPPSIRGVWNTSSFCANLNGQGMTAWTMPSDYVASRDITKRPEYPGSPSPAGDASLPGFSAWNVEPDEPDIDVNMVGYPNNIDPAATRNVWISRSNYLRGLNPGAIQFGNFAGSNLAWVHKGSNYHTFTGLYESDFIAMMQPLDVIGSDYYPQNSNDISMQGYVAVLDALEAQAAAAGNKRFLMFIESSDQHLGRGGRGPTTDELRGEIWMALIYGASAIAYFPQAVRTPVSDDATTAEAAAEMTVQNALIKFYEPALARPGTHMRSGGFHRRVIPLADGTSRVISLNFSAAQAVSPYDHTTYGPYEVKFFLE